MSQQPQKQNCYTQDMHFINPDTQKPVTCPPAQGQIPPGVVVCPPYNPNEHQTHNYPPNVAVCPPYNPNTHQNHQNQKHHWS